MLDIQSNEYRSIFWPRDIAVLALVVLALALVLPLAHTHSCHTTTILPSHGMYEYTDKEVICVAPSSITCIFNVPTNLFLLFHTNFLLLFLLVCHFPHSFVFAMHSVRYNFLAFSPMHPCTQKTRLSWISIKYFPFGFVQCARWYNVTLHHHQK